MTSITKRSITQYGICLLASLLLLVPVYAQESVAVVNAASFEVGFPVSPGCWASAFGDFSSAGAGEGAAGSLPFPTTMGGVQLFVNDVASALNFVGPTQINFLVPSETPSQGKVGFRVVVNGTTTFNGTINMWPVSPGLLSVNPADPTKPGAVLNQDFTLNSSGNPAEPGEVIQIFGVGADFASFPSVPGSAAPGDPPVVTKTIPKVYVSTVEAAVQFSGMAPGLVNTWQINVVVPDNSFIQGQVPIIADIQGAKTNLVSIWVAK